MRKLELIIDDCVNGEIPSHEECYCALQVYRRMLNLNQKKLNEELLSEQRSSLLYRTEVLQESFNFYKEALNRDPKEWLLSSNQTNQTADTMK